MLVGKEGPLDAQQIESRLTLFSSPFTRSAKFQRSRDDKQEMTDVVANCNQLVQDGIIQSGEDGKFTLTENGQLRYNELTTYMSKIERSLLTPQAASRISILTNGVMAVSKLLGGFFSGSIGLLADGVDAGIDTTSAVIAWVGIKVKREIIGTIVTIGLMFFSAISLSYEGIRAVIGGLLIGFNPVTLPFLIIGVETGVFFGSMFLKNYLGYVGKRSGNLTLISQSVDAKNHSFIAIAVIMSAILSLWGIDFVDSLIGIVIALRIILDAIALVKDARLSASGEMLDLSKYETHFEKQWNERWIESYKAWVLYSINEYHKNTKAELIETLEKTFKVGYVPLLSDFAFDDSNKYDFEAHFDELIQALEERTFISEKEGKFTITQKGKSFLGRQNRVLRLNYRQH